MVVPLWEIGRFQQLLSCKEMEINRRGTLEWEDIAGKVESARLPTRNAV
jgi:hypothetical protein